MTSHHFRFLEAEWPMLLEAKTGIMNQRTQVILIRQLQHRVVFIPLG